MADKYININPVTSGDNLMVMDGHYKSLANIDLDDIKYSYSGYVSSGTNVPTGATRSGELICAMRDNGLYGLQIYKGYQTSGIYYRQLTNGTWGSWSQINAGIDSGVYTPTYKFLNNNVAPTINSQTINYRVSGKFMLITGRFQMTATNITNADVLEMSLPTGYNYVTSVGQTGSVGKPSQITGADMIARFNSTNLQLCSPSGGSLSFSTGWYSIFAILYLS